jgi:hypothetical protein
MPDGYKCDRCSEFVETGRYKMDSPNGPPRRVAVHPQTDSDKEFSLNDYTLCPRCRDELVNWVECYE